MIKEPIMRPFSGGLPRPPSLRQRSNRHSPERIGAGPALDFPGASV
jgi:hypothetical protein